MCGGISEKDINIVCSLFYNLIITLFFIYEFVQLSFDGEIYWIIAILSIWLISKLAAIINFLKNVQEKFGYYLLSVLISSEWTFSGKYMQNSDVLITQISQIIIYTFPINICNIYLLSDTTRNINHGYYIAIIYVYYIFIGIAIITSIGENLSQDYLQKGVFFSSIIINFCYWYLLIQSFTYSWIIGICFIISNIIAFIIDLVFLKDDYSSYHYYSYENIFYKTLQYLFQFNAYSFNYYIVSKWSSKKSKLKLKSWNQLFPLCVQCFNVILLSIIKFVLYPLIIQTDKSFYVFLFLSLTQIILCLVNVYFKLMKQNQYHLNVKWNENEIKIDKKAYKLSSDRFTYDYKINFEIDPICLENKYQQSFIKNFQCVKNFINKAALQSKHLSYVSFIDIKNQCQLSLIFGQYQKAVEVQQFTLEDEFFDNEKNQQMFQYLSQLQTKQVKTTFNINNNDIQKIYNLMIQTQSFDLINYVIEPYEKTLFTSYQNVQTILSQITSQYYSALGFHKVISKYMTVKPELALYDLFEDYN